MAVGRKFFACCTMALFACLLLAGQAAAAPPANDNFASATTIAPTAPGIGGSNVGATKEAGEPAHAGDMGGASVWYSWTAPATGVFNLNSCGSSFDTLLAVYKGTSLGSLTPVVSNDESIGCPSQSRVAFHATNGTTYRIAVDGYSAGGFALPDTGNIQLHLGQNTGAPFNDNFAGSTVLSGTTDFDDGSNVGATKQAGEPAHGGNQGGASVWYSWTAPASGATTIDTCSSEFDTLLGVWTGNAVNTLTPVATDNDGCGDGTGSLVQFAAVQGITYRIAVDGSNAAPDAPAEGAFELFVHVAQPPANDNFAAATALSGASAFAGGENFEATAETGEPAHAGVGPFQSVWYQWIAPFTGPVTIDTCGSDFDTVLAVYTGGAVNALTPVATSNNSSSCSPQSRVNFIANGGTTYRIAVDGDFDFGDISLHLAESPGATVADKTAPESTIKKVTVDSEHHKATFRFSTTESGSSFSCKLDHKAFRSCHSPKTYRHLKSGKHKVKIAAIDAAGNRDQTPAVKTFKIEP
jgi:hypothetical protein